MTERQKERNTKRHKDKKTERQKDRMMTIKNWYKDDRNMSERWQKDVRKMSECQNYWHTEWLTSMGKTAPPWGRRPVPEEDNLSSTKSICPHESFVFWEIIREFTHSNSSFEYVSDFSNFVFGDVVLFSKCLSHDFFTFSFAFCFFPRYLKNARLFNLTPKYFLPLLHLLT